MNDGSKIFDVFVMVNITYSYRYLRKKLLLNIRQVVLSAKLIKVSELLYFEGNWCVAKVTCLVTEFSHRVAKRKNSLRQKQNSETLCESNGVKNGIKKDTYYVYESSHNFIKITMRPI